MKTPGRPILSAGRILLSEEQAASLLSFDTNRLCIGHSNTREVRFTQAFLKAVYQFVNGVSFDYYSPLPLSLVALLTNQYSYHIYVALFTFVFFFNGRFLFSYEAENRVSVNFFCNLGYLGFGFLFYGSGVAKGRLGAGVRYGSLGFIICH